MLKYFSTVILLLLSFFILFGCATLPKNCGDGVCATDFGENSLTCPTDCGPSLNNLNNPTGASQPPALDYSIPWMEEYKPLCYAIIGGVTQDRSLRIGVDEYYGMTGSVSSYGDCAGKSAEIVTDFTRYNADGTENLDPYVIPLQSFNSDGSVTSTKINLGYFKGVGEAVCTSIGAVGTQEGIVPDDRTVTIRAMPSQADCERYGAERCKLKPAGICYDGTCPARYSQGDAFSYCEFKSFLLDGYVSLYQGIYAQPTDQEVIISQPNQELTAPVIKLSNSQEFFGNKASFADSPVSQDLQEMEIEFKKHAAEYDDLAKRAEKARADLRKMTNKMLTGGVGGIRVNDWIEYTVERGEDGEPRLVEKLNRDGLSVDLSEADWKLAEERQYLREYTKALRQSQEELQKLIEEIKAKYGKHPELIMGKLDEATLSAYTEALQAVKWNELQIEASNKMIAKMSTIRGTLKNLVANLAGAEKATTSAVAAKRATILNRITAWSAKIPGCREAVKRIIPGIAVLVGIAQYKVVAQDIDQKNYAGASDKIMGLLVPTHEVTKTYVQSTAEWVQIQSQYNELKQAIDDDLRNTYAPQAYTDFELRSHGGGRCDNSIDNRGRNLQELEYQKYLEWQERQKNSPSPSPYPSE